MRRRGVGVGAMQNKQQLQVSQIPNIKSQNFEIVVVIALLGCIV